MSIATKEYDWDPEVYQKNLSFVPKLASRIMQWLDADKDDAILDLGCGDGVLDVDLGQIVSQGNGRLVGVDSSQPMIEAAKKAVAAASSPAVSERCTFEVMDATTLVDRPDLQKGEFTKVFSSSAMHWIMGPSDRREVFLQGVKAALKPGGTFVFEMGGSGNVSEMRAAMLAAVSRRVGGLDKIVEPWFFPDEAWMKTMLEDKIGGFKIEKSEMEWRATWADQGGCDGWVRLVGAQLFDLVSEEEREECIKEAVGVTEVVCRMPDGKFAFNYVRLRVVARRLY
ncbi:S-adenosyl-L-methionine-dependent methyltransferase [Podospora australis]|uniref:S-adenosyl-L-methionine-dependent methyltransferase n=1 Tax=Podospora australis TaxID=1536484 RepID=A0AAN7AC63_9PEZI|nr:S-adenosyl-L-methionine-dependent methyltransferase [Podospora australis]